MSVAKSERTYVEHNIFFCCLITSFYNFCSSSLPSTTRTKWTNYQRLTFAFLVFRGVVLELIAFGYTQPRKLSIFKPIKINSSSFLLFNLVNICPINTWIASSLLMKQSFPFLFFPLFCPLQGQCGSIKKRG